MPGDGVKIGPFLGGLNTHSDASAVADNEMVECENLELDLDGSLKSRPPFADLDIDLPLAASGQPQLLGVYSVAGADYMIASDGNSSTYYFNGSSWILITATFAATAMSQFNDRAWLLAPLGSAAPGGYWAPTGGFTTDPDMPKGDAMVSHKFRLWIIPGRNAPTNGTRLYYSKVLGVPNFWQAPGFIDIGAGDGENLVAVTVWQENLLVFRTESVYNYSYSTDPTAGTASKIIAGIGLAHKNAFTASENYIYFMYNDRAYEFVQYRATQINVKVPFTSGSRTGVASPYAVSSFNKRIIFHYFDKLFVFNLSTRTWTLWRSSVHGAIGKIVEVQLGSELIEAVGFTAKVIPAGASRSAATLFIRDGITELTEAMVCSVRTKNFNYDAPSLYKRLFWWGADALFRGTVTATAVPVVQNSRITWEALRNHTWAELLNFNWDQPMSASVEVETNVPTAGSGASRKFVKFNKGLRFRQIYYRLTFETDGSADTAPVRLYQLMTYVKAKETVSKAVS